MKTESESAALDQAAQSAPILADWTARRPCDDCDSLDLARPSPVLPQTLAPAVYLLDDAMLEGPHRLLLTFVCRSCGRRWRFDSATSEWDQVLR